MSDIVTCHDERSSKEFQRFNLVCGMVIWLFHIL